MGLPTAGGGRGLVIRGPDFEKTGSFAGDGDGFCGTVEPWKCSDEGEHGWSVRTQDKTGACQGPAGWGGGDDPALFVCGNWTAASP